MSTNREQSTGDLFGDLPAQPSPRLAWIQRHHVCLIHSAGDDAQWEARDSSSAGLRSLIGLGDTEDEALADAAHRCGWKLWNEEEAL